MPGWYHHRWGEFRVAALDGLGTARLMPDKDTQDQPAEKPAEKVETIRERTTEREVRTPQPDSEQPRDAG